MRGDRGNPVLWWVDRLLLPKQIEARFPHRVRRGFLGDFELYGKIRISGQTSLGTGEPGKLTLEPYAFSSPKRDCRLEFAKLLGVTAAAVSSALTLHNPLRGWKDQLPLLQTGR